jgi:hypothetical protein
MIQTFKQADLVMLEGEDQGEHFLTKLGSFREGPGQEYPKPASVCEEFDDSGRSEKCV